MNPVHFDSALDTAGKRGLLARAIRHASAEFAAAEVSSGGSSDSMESFVKALKKEPAKVHVDVSEALKKCTLEMLPQACWPPGELIDGLASEASQLTRIGVNKPFVYVELRKYVPYWCTDEPPVVAEGKCCLWLCVVWWTFATCTKVMNLTKSQRRSSS